MLSIHSAPAFAGERWCRRHQKGGEKSGRRPLITAMQFLLMNPKAFSCNQPDGGGRLAAPFCMPPVDGGPLWWLAPPPSPRCEACHWILSRPRAPYESSSLATPASLVGLWVLSIVPHDSTGKRRADLPSGGGAVGRRGAFPRAKPGLPVFPSRQRRGCKGFIIRGGLHHLKAAHHRRLVFNSICLIGGLYRDSLLRSE